jgi:hypothetical protein
MGLSDYLVYDVQHSIVSASVAPVYRASGRSSTVPQSIIVAGTTGGMYQYATSGTGIVYGSITDRDNGSVVPAAEVSTGCGSSCASADGYYLLLLPAGNHTLAVEASGYHRAVVSDVTVLAGQSLMQDVALDPLADGQFCLAASLLQGSPDRAVLQALRTFRDSVLAGSQQGRDLTAVYYAGSAPAIRMLRHHPGLFARCRALLYKLLPYVQAANSGTGGPIPCALLNEAHALLFDVEHASPSAALRDTIRSVRQKLTEDCLLKLLKH